MFFVGNSLSSSDEVKVISYGRGCASVEINGVWDGDVCRGPNGWVPLTTRMVQRGEDDRPASPAYRTRREAVAALVNRTFTYAGTEHDGPDQ